jgi:hypothetical protein
MITFFVLLVLAMVLIAVAIPALQGGWGGRRVIVERRRDMVEPDMIEEVVDDDLPLRPMARRRVVRRRTY